VNDIIIGDATLRYYPNPARTVLYIDVPQMSTKKMTAILYDLNGRKISTTSVETRPEPGAGTSLIFRDVSTGDPVWVGKDRLESGSNKIKQHK
jgi:hypothetical protein